VVGDTPEHFSAHFIGSEIAKWAKVINDAGTRDGEVALAFFSPNRRRPDRRYRKFRLENLPHGHGRVRWVRIVKDNHRTGMTGSRERPRLCKGHEK